MKQRDADLVRVALAGGPEAFNAIVERYRGQVFGVALARLGDFDEAEDIAQQVFIEAFEKLAALRDPGRLGPWLRSATIHRCIDLLRQRREHLDLDKATAELATGVTPEMELERHQTRQHVLAAIGRLGKAQRETTTLFYLGGHSIAGVAALLEIPPGTVKRRLHDARQRLKTEMLQMVEDTLQAEAPREDFSQRVFDLLARFHRHPETWPRTWPEMLAADERWEAEMGDPLRAFGADGLAGFARAIQHPQALTRRHAVQCAAFMHDSLANGDVQHADSAQLQADLLGLLKGALKDRNKKVRFRAAFYLLGKMQMLDEEYVARDIIPLVRPMLRDPVAYVRERIARLLCSWARYVPLEEAAAALASYPQLRQPSMSRLVLSIIEARKEQAT